MLRYFLILLGCMLVCVACQRLDVSSDTLPPLVNPTSKGIGQQITFMSSIIEENPQVAEYYYRRSLLFYEDKKLLAAQQDIEKALSLDTNNSKFLFVKAQILAQANQLTQAIATAELAATKGLKQVDLYLLLSKLYYKAEKPIEAILYLRKVKEILPDKAEVYYYQGLISYDVADTLNTVRYMEKALAIAPDYLDAYTYLVRLYLQYDKPVVALRYLKRAMQDSVMKRNAGLNKLYGDMLTKLERKDDRTEAIVWYEKAVALDSTQWEAAQYASQYYLYKKNYQLSVNYLQKALQAKKDIQGGAYLLGAIYEYHLKNYYKAKDAYTAAQKLQPLNGSIAADISRMERRIAYEEYKKTPEYQKEMAKRKHEETSTDSIVLPPVLSNTPTDNK